MIAGIDHIGIGVGAMVFNTKEEVFLAKRGPTARNEKGYWEFPGGSLEFGEKLGDAIRREFNEEYGMDIEVTELLGIFDHILDEGKKHWVSVTYIAQHISGTPQILESDKCTDIGWFPLTVLPEPLSKISVDNLKAYSSQKSRE